MIFKNTCDRLNVIKQCRSYGLGIWQCPQFLFLIMGAIIMITSLVFYLVGARYVADPAIVALINICVTGVLFIIAFIITRSFERLAEASRMKSEFINIVSHQLRSPITNIKWIVDFLSSAGVQIDKEKKEEYFTHMNENVARMVELVDDLLIVAKIEQGDFPLREKQASLEELIRDIINRSKIFSQALNIKIEFNTAKDVPKLLYFDPTLMRMVIENLVDNAIHYTKGGGSVAVQLKRTKNKVIFKIEDSGVGIPLSDQKFIFKKFFRSENALRDQTRGSGLGLYISKSIVEKSGGKIWFDSEEGKGTTFYFTLPIK